MTSPAQASAVPSSAATAANDLDQDIGDEIRNRETREVIIAFSGAIGAGISDIVPMFRTTLSAMGYRVETDLLKVSTLIREHAPKLLKDEAKFGALPTEGLERYEKFQDAGNALREAFGNDVLAKLTVAKISTLDGRPEIAADPTKLPERVAYFIDSFKHPDEIRFLRQVYGNTVYIVGVLSAEIHRTKRLESETGAAEGKVKELIERDRKEDIGHGQQLDKALKLADFFVRNSAGNRMATERQVKRFCEIMHGAVSVAPTREEFGMYVAYSAGLSSACMSRQVGAAILASDGTVLATGCNDVPKAGGGLYGGPGEAPDHRCVMSDGICHNDLEKDVIKREIEKILVDEGFSEAASRVAARIKNETRLGDLIEFSRAVHAEMDALVAISRRGGASTVGATLYTTTYPCHNCARHILASGISEVVYVEPYEKSLAIKLHRDAIEHDCERGTSPGQKIPFLHFEGVSPRRYQELFIFANGRKRAGKRLDVDLMKSSKKIPQQLDGYRDIEAKVVEWMVGQNLIDPP